MISISKFTSELLNMELNSSVGSFGSTSFNSINLCAIFWGSEKYEHKNIENRALTFRLRPSRAQMSTSTLTHAFSVRCVKD